MLQVIDNFIDPLICKAIYLNVLRSPMFIQTPKGKEKDPSFFISNVSEQDNIVLYLLLKAKEIFKKDLKCLRAYANVQFKGQHSNWHIDDGDFTILLMVSETLNDGKFELVLIL